MATAAARSTGKEMQNLTLASLGAVLEYFDFQVYVFVAAILGTAIFPPGQSIWKTQVQTFGIYAIGYLVRPIAGMVIAHFADRVGRKKLFIFTVLLMSVPTLLMGLLPTYAVAGWLAPAALLVLRILQGCAVGGELPGASVFVCEHARPRRLGVSGGFFYGMVNFGLLLGAAAAAVAQWVSGLDPSLSALAWRLPFILGGGFGLVAAYLRRHLEETPMFEEIRREQKLSRAMPLAAVLRDHRGPCAFALALVFTFATTPALYFQYMPTYFLTVVHMEPALVFRANAFGVAAFVAAMPLWGLLRDRVGWQPMLVLAGVLNAASAVWFFQYVPTLGPADPRLVYAMMAVGFLSAIPHSLIAALISALFPTAIRQSGFAFPYSVGTALVSGLTPLGIAALVRSYGLTAPMVQAVLGGAVALGLAVFVRRLPLFLGETAVGETAAADPALVPVAVLQARVPTSSSS